MERVIFLYEKDSTEVFAFFLDMKEYNNYYNSYAHIGQHSVCSLEYAKECKEAKVSDIFPLYQELIQIGYDIKTTSKDAIFWI